MRRLARKNWIWIILLAGFLIIYKLHSTPSAEIPAHYSDGSSIRIPVKTQNVTTQNETWTLTRNNAGAAFVSVYNHQRLVQIFPSSGHPEHRHQDLVFATHGNITLSGVLYQAEQIVVDPANQSGFIILKKVN